MHYHLGTSFRVDARGRFIPPPAMAEAARHYAEGRAAEAVRCCEAVIAEQPGYGEAHHLLGVLRLDGGEPEAALAPLLRARALALAPNRGRIEYNLGNAYQALGRQEEAEPCYRAALVITPGASDVLNNLGNSVRALGREEEAVGLYQAALAQRADNPPALLNLAGSLRRLGRFDEAERALRALLTERIAPVAAERLAEARDGLVAVLIELGRDEEALDLVRRYPSLTNAEWHESLLLLRLGRLREAWPKYERRWDLPGFLSDQDSPPPPVPALDQVADRRVLVRAEQGRGDAIQFCRYIPLLARRGAAVTFAVASDLVRLMRTLPGVERVIDADDASPAADITPSLLSLPLAFGTVLGSIPADIPYLAPPKMSRETWAERLGSPTGRRIGLCWRGAQHIPERSIPIAELAPLLAVSGCEFHVVQKDITDVDRGFIAGHGGLACHDTALTDFAETAALLARMDLVITIDTAVAHLAGALGLPVWVLLRRSADWRWLLHREDSPWYPTARLFRQDAGGKWEPVIARVAEALRAA